jgi:hypothetical protein
MRKFVLAAGAAAALAFVVPQFATAAPVIGGAALGCAADAVATTENAYYGYYRRHYRRYYRRNYYYRRGYY